MTTEQDQLTLEKEKRKAQRREAWERTEEKLTPENKTEFFIYSLITGLALLGFGAILSLLFDWPLDLGHTLYALFGGVALTCGSVDGQKILRIMKEEEEKRKSA